PDLEALVVHQGYQVAGPLQLAVGEDVPVDEPAFAGGGLGVVRAGDAVVEQAPPGAELAVEEREIARQLALADVLGQPDRADRVELALRDVPVIEVTDLRQAGQARPLDSLAAPGRLLPGQSDAERADAVFAGRVHDHAAPAAADVEQPDAAAQAEFARDQVELVLLSLFQRRVRRRVTGTGVG